MPRISASAARPAEEPAETVYYDYEWNPCDLREHAAFAIHVIRDASGRVLERRHESFKPVPTRSTDPKTGSHQHAD